MKTLSVKSILLSTLFAAIMFLPSNSFAKRTADPNIGKHLYRSYCQICHGKDGNTTGPLAKKMRVEPAKLATNKYGKKSAEEIAKIIGGYGRMEGSKMPQWNEALPKANIDHLAAYLTRLNQHRISFKGDARRGRMIYKTACVACHGQHGKGNGVMASLIGINMIHFEKLGQAQKITDKELARIISEGKGDYMPSWHDTLNEGEIEDLVAYVRELGR